MLSALLRAIGIYHACHISPAAQVELANLISDAQSGGVQKVVEEIVANPSAYLVTIGEVPFISMFDVC